MKKALLLSILLLSQLLNSIAQQHDTITVQTFTYGSSQDAWFQLPPDTTGYEKILMHYKLKCNPAQSPACGEWDYLTYTYLYDHTGVLDSTLYTAPSFTVGGLSPDTFNYMYAPTYSYVPHFQQYIVHTDTLSLNEYALGQAQSSSDETFNSSQSDSRAQYIWKVNELTSAGVTAGDISGISFQFSGTGSELKNLQVRIKHSALDSLTPEAYETSGFQTVYLRNTTVSVPGIIQLDFIAPFTWNGTSNLVIDLSFDNTSSGIANPVMESNTNWNSGVISGNSDNYLDFEGPDYVQVPSTAFAELDSFITVMFWQYGDAAIQPQANMIFEAYNAQNERVLNVHLPWDNGNIYWDAGNASGFDRIELAAQPAQYEGQWNHWAFTKNVATGSMKIYINGTLFHSGTGMTRTMTGVTNFKIGSAAPGNLNYDGYIDEFSFWNKELDMTTIQEWLNKNIDNTHPDFNELGFYYHFDEAEGTIATDASGNSFDGELAGLPQRKTIEGAGIFRNLTSTQQRPYIVILQNDYQSHLDSVLVIDTVETERLQLLLYADSLNPLVATDTIGVWPVQSINYIYDSGGNAIDSTEVSPDGSVYLSTWEYYGEPFEVIDRYELGRYITPYGFGLDLHDGFTWIYDVSDFEPLLHDSVHLSAGNWQELLDLKFEFITGTPAREVLSVENIWNGDFALSNFDTRVTAQTLLLDPLASMYNLKTTASGHGWDNPSNCAEFCPKTHTIKLDGTNIRSFQLWKKCASNPLYPQGGTWLVDRAAWCPGAPVDVYNTELTDLITPGDSVSLDYDIQSNQYGNYVFESQLISYGAANFTLDAAVEDIISPSNKDEHYRDNPICMGPKIIIKNNGTSALTALTITYSVAGGVSSTQNWSGNLDFLETEIVELGALNWTGISGGQGTFEVTLSNANGSTDQYTFNNTMRSDFTVPRVREFSFVIWTRTNASPSENSWTIKDESGTVLYLRDNMAANTTYKDTVELPNGCFELDLIDEGEDGMDWWAGEQGGYIRLKSATSNATLENFDSKWTIAASAGQYRGDFGSGFKYHFTTGFALPVQEYAISNEVFVYPNPSKGLITVDLLLNKNETAQIEVMTLDGQLLYTKQLSGSDFYSEKIDLGAVAKGIYMVNVRTAGSVVTRKVVME